MLTSVTHRSLTSVAAVDTLTAIRMARCPAIIGGSSGANSALLSMQSSRRHSSSSYYSSNHTMTPPPLPPTPSFIAIGTFMSNVSTCPSSFLEAEVDVSALTTNPTPALQKAKSEKDGHYNEASDNRRVPRDIQRMREVVENKQKEEKEEGYNFDDFDCYVAPSASASASVSTKSIVDTLPSLMMKKTFSSSSSSLYSSSSSRHHHVTRHYSYQAQQQGVRFSSFDSSYKRGVARQSSISSSSPFSSAERSVISQQQPIIIANGFLFDSLAEHRRAISGGSNTITTQKPLAVRTPAPAESTAAHSHHRKDDDGSTITAASSSSSSSLPPKKSPSSSSMGGGGEWSNNPTVAEGGARIFSPTVDPYSEFFSVDSAVESALVATRARRLSSALRSSRRRSLSSSTTTYYSPQQRRLLSSASVGGVLGMSGGGKSRSSSSSSFKAQLAIAAAAAAKKKERTEALAQRVAQAEAAVRAESCSKRQKLCSSAKLAV